jgi:asparagine synthetase B (glutamine-hydrolysing)
MAWGLEARVPFLDKSFLDIAMNIAPQDKMFGKGSKQQVDEDGCPRMEKVRPAVDAGSLFAEQATHQTCSSTYCARLSM